MPDTVSNGGPVKALDDLKRALDRIAELVRAAEGFRQAVDHAIEAHKVLAASTAELERWRDKLMEAEVSENGGSR